MTDYKYNEDKLLKEIEEYVNATYSQHYSQNKFQATEFILDSGHGEGFCLGNILKYAQRYGKKGTPEDWRKDLMKVIHYAIIALYNHDQKFQKSGTPVFDLSDTMIIPVSDIPSTGITLTSELGYYVNLNNEIQPQPDLQPQDETVEQAVQLLSKMAKAEKTYKKKSLLKKLDPNAPFKPKIPVKLDSNEPLEDWGHNYDTNNWSSDDLFELKETK